MPPSAADACWVADTFIVWRWRPHEGGPYVQPYDPVVAAARRSSLTRLMWLSIAAAVTTIGLKTVAWQVTGSVGLLSDALESLVNLGAAVTGLILLRWAASPPDQRHMFGHDKAEY